jgi:hypothetical protein
MTVCLASPVARLCLIVFAVSLVGQPVAATDESDVLITRNTRFEIPYELDATSDEPVSGFAVLYGSDDDGENWTRLQSVPAARGAFIFTAPRDGRYSFAIRMTDERGVLLEKIEGSEPELQIEVDTEGPEIDVKVTEPEPGKALIAWNCRDQRVDVSSLALEVVDGTTGARRQAKVEADIKGEALLPVPQGGVMQVRVSILDLAGNRGESRVNFESDANFLSRPDMQSPDTPAKKTDPDAPVQPIGPTPFPMPEPKPEPEPEPLPVPEPAPMPMPMPEPVPMPMPEPVPMPKPMPMPEPAPMPKPQPPQLPPVLPQPEPQPQIPELPPTRPAPPKPPAEPDQSQQDFSDEEPKLHYVNNKMFSLDYSVEDVGPSGVASVDLFVTENGGRQWFRYGSDTDRKSPFQIDTMGEGTFGFSLRIKNGVGVADIPPQPGESPEILITVDQTPPAIEMAQPTVRKGANGVVQFNWRIREINPATESVRLEMAAATGGPWSNVFDWQADRGGFEMPLSEGLPPAVHFRLTARDAAGNLTSAQTVRPVVVDLHKPSGRLLRVSPSAR